MHGTSDIDELWREFKDHGGGCVHDRLVLHYAPLVKYVAGRVRAGLPDYADQADLVSDGVLGLMDAVDKFDLERGLQFQTYAVQRIRGAIIDGLRAADWVPRSVREDVRNIEAALSVLESRFGQTPDDREVAAELDVSVADLRNMYRQASYATLVSMEAHEDANATTPRSCQIALDADDNLPEVLDAVRRLPERDQIVLALHYWEGFTLTEVGQVLGVSASRVSQLHSRATMRLRGKLVDA